MDSFSGQPEIETYFRILPKEVQDAIRQSGASFTSVESLRALARHLAGRDTVG